MHALLFEMEIVMLRAEVDPPPNTHHLAVRTGKRYGKTSLTAQHGRDRARAIAECREHLGELDPDGTLEALGRVGLITFKDCKPAMAEALGIPAERTGHFSRLRGSNAACGLRRPARGGDANAAPGRCGPPGAPTIMRTRS